MNGPDTDMASDSELDAALGWRNQQGRNGDWPMPEEFPPLNARTFAIAVAVAFVAAFVSAIFDGWAR